MEKQIILTPEQAITLVQKCMQLGEVKYLPIQTAAKLFLQIKSVQDVTQATLNYYSQMIGYALDYFERTNITKTSEITNEVIYSYIEYLLVTKRTSKSYVNKIIGAVLHLHQTLVQMNHIEHYQFTFKRMKEEIKEIKILTAEEIQRLANYIPTRTLHRQLALRLFLETGIRRTELIKIKICNLDLDNNRVYLTHTKNRESRYIFVSDTTKELIIKQLKRYDKNIEYLFSSGTDKHFSTSFVDSLFAKTKKDLNYNTTQTQNSTTLHNRKRKETSKRNTNKKRIKSAAVCAHVHTHVIVRSCQVIQ